MPPRSFELSLPSRVLKIGHQPIIVGVLNVTPDSFYDGGRYANTSEALRRGLSLIEAGAEWIDIGGESSRPGAEPVSAQQEMDRVLPVIAALKKETEFPISIDTMKASVAREALREGAEIVNDVSALSFDLGMTDCVLQTRAAVVLNHMRETPATMQKTPRYQDPVAEILSELGKRIEQSLRAGISRDKILADPGIGFGKRVEDNLQILRRFHEFQALEVPLFVGVSRKSFIGKILDDRPSEGRLFGTAAALTAAVLGGAQLLRVHDPAEMKDVARVAAAIASVHDHND